MRTNQIVSRCILAGIFVYLIFQILYLSCYLLHSAIDKEYKSIVVLFIAQSVLFATAILFVFIASFLQYRKEKRISPFEAMLVISSERKTKIRILLHDKH